MNLELIMVAHSISCYFCDAGQWYYFYYLVIVSACGSAGWSIWDFRTQTISICGWLGRSSCWGLRPLLVCSFFITLYNFIIIHGYISVPIYDAVSIYSSKFWWPLVFEHYSTVVISEHYSIRLCRVHEMIGLGVAAGSYILNLFAVFISWPFVLS